MYEQTAGWTQYPQPPAATPSGPVEAQRYPRDLEHMRSCPPGHARVCRPKDILGQAMFTCPKVRHHLPGRASTGESLQLCAQHTDNVCFGERRVAPGEGGVRTTPRMSSLVEPLTALLGVPSIPAGLAAPSSHLAQFPRTCAYNVLLTTSFMLRGTFTSLSPSFHMCKMGKITALTQ